jgi:hypothetical protein
MIKYNEKNKPDSCFNKADDTEWLFVLLGRDLAGGDTVRYWVSRRLELGLNRSEDRQIKEALEAARQMDKQAAERNGY